MHTSAQISAGEKRRAREPEEYERECSQRRVGEEGDKPTPAEDGQA
jgi:hypothetical protein